ncbi:MAG: DUF4976 domain-containing protein [Candidatus Moduliflexus flocculans]|nr:DUF4976 domain-containing protein [Candidatus Moduliflexus flocculans]
MAPQERSDRLRPLGRSCPARATTTTPTSSRWAQTTRAARLRHRHPDRSGRRTSSKPGRSGDRPFLLMLHHKAPHRELAAGRAAPAASTTTPRSPSRRRSSTTTPRGPGRAFEQEMTIRDHMTLDSDLKLGPPPGRLDAAQQRRPGNRPTGPSARPSERAGARRATTSPAGSTGATSRTTSAASPPVDESVGRVLDVLDRDGPGRGHASSSTPRTRASSSGSTAGSTSASCTRRRCACPSSCACPARDPAGLDERRDRPRTSTSRPTFLDAAGAGKPARDAGPVVPAAPPRPDASAGWPESVYYHYYEYPAVHMAKRHYGVRTRALQAHPLLPRHRRLGALRPREGPARSSATSRRPGLRRRFAASSRPSWPQAPGLLPRRRAGTAGSSRPTERSGMSLPPSESSSSSWPPRCSSSSCPTGCGCRRSSGFLLTGVLIGPGGLSLVKNTGDGRRHGRDRRGHAPVHHRPGVRAVPAQAHPAGLLGRGGLQVSLTDLGHRRRPRSS